MFLQGYSWNTANVGVKHQSINEYIYTCIFSGVRIDVGRLFTAFTRVSAKSIINIYKSFYSVEGNTLITNCK